MRFTPAQQLYRFLIVSNVRRWFLPLACAVPYLGSLVWLFQRGQVWIVQIMLAPLLMMLLLGLLTFFLARLEFRSLKDTKRSSS